MVPTLTKHVPEEVWEFPKIGSKKQRIHYVPEAFRHPAKMDVYLTRRLLKTFTKPGDVVLDPMAGIGTTGVEAVLLGRHTILVDIEKKFTKLCEKNLENVYKFFQDAPFKPKLGKAVVITGDSRHLTDLLRTKADTIVTSPPYSHISKPGNIKNPISKEEFEKRKKMGDHSVYHDIRPERKGTLYEYYEMIPIENYGGEDNIDRLPHGDVDAVITSPPFSEGQFDYKHGMNKYVSPNWKGRRAFIERRKMKYSEGNITILKHGDVDAIVTSPPYSSSSIQDYATSNKALLDFEKQIRESFRTKGYFEYNGKKYTEQEWRRINKGELKPRGIPELWAKIVRQKKQTKYNDDNPDNIANLEHGKIDVVLTSPPYSESMTKKRKGYTVIPQLAKTREMPQDTKDENIANLTHGKVDAVITSPPYANIHQCPTNTGMTEFFRKQLEEKGYIEWNGKRYTEAEWRAMNHGRLDGRSTRGVKKDAKYSDNPQNIGNLPHTENVDVILTSPPYADGYKASSKTREEQAKRVPKNILKKRSDGGGPLSLFKSEKNVAAKGFLEGMPKNPGNIGNLPLGKVDAILTSPPYSEGIGHSSNVETLGIRTEETVKHSQSFKAKVDLTAKHMLIKKSRKNIGSLKHGNVDAILTSPPYAEALSHKNVGHGKRNIANKEKSVKGDPQQYSDNQENVGNLPYQNVDTIITSPPFAEANRGGGIAQKGYEGKYGKDEKLHLRHDRPLSNNPKNVSNLPLGKVDTVITSPPFGSSTLAEGLRGRDLSKQKDFIKKRHQDYREIGAKGNPENIGYLKVEVKKEKSPKKGKTETYLEAMLKCYREMYKVLKPGGLCIVVLKNFIRNWKVVDLIGDTIKLCEFVGFKLQRKIKFRLPTKSFWRVLYERQYKKKFGKPLPKEFDSVYKYETVLVFKK